MPEPMHITAPLDAALRRSLRAGQSVLLSGVIYTGRDAAHARLVEALREGRPLPFALRDQVIYYAGPCPAPPGRIIGSIGPTTSSRMDAYAPLLMREGLTAMIGKGLRSAEVVRVMRETASVYFSAIGGAAALMADCVKSAELVAFAELGTEAVRRLRVERLPLIVAIDAEGRSVYPRDGACLQDKGESPC